MTSEPRPIDETSLIYYGQPELIDYRTGYPWAWEGKSAYDSPMHPPRFVRIPDYVRELAGHRCLRCGHPYLKGDERISPRGEWSPCDELCHHEGPTRVTPVLGDELQQGVGERIARAFALTEAQWRILTVHHLDEDKANCRWWNLAALCQRCHLRMQRAVVMDRVYSFEHSEWFKPFAAGFYAWKYEGLELSRDETMARLEELLAHEQQFRQEAIF